MTRRLIGLRKSAWVALGVLLALSAIGGARAAKLRVVHSFCSAKNCSDGNQPSAGLVADAHGNLYGTTTWGGSAGIGTAFELMRAPSGKFEFKTIYNFCATFCDVQSPQGRLIIDSNGNLYGVGTNAVYELSPGFGRKGHLWKETALYEFCSQQNCTDGSSPVGHLTYAGDSRGDPYDGTSPLYGVTALGGTHGQGVAFSLTPENGRWSMTGLYSFCSRGGQNCTDGKNPDNLFLDQSGHFFGLTAGGGNHNGIDGNGAGVVFELTPRGGKSWTETVLYRFCSANQCSDGMLPLGELIENEMGNLFGNTSGGGRRCDANPNFGCGTVFKLIPNGQNTDEIVLHTFCSKKDCSDGLSPTGAMAMDAVGNLFGVTEYGGGIDIDQNLIGGGAVFEIADGGAYKVLHSFCSLEDCADGEYPVAALFVDASGHLVGNTSRGGDFGLGTVFNLKH